MPCYTKKTEEGVFFLCGEFGPMCADCAWTGDILCDYPVGEGLTCDRAICESHATEIAPELHYCAAHLAMWQAFLATGGVKNKLENLVPFRSIKGKS